VLLSLTAWTSVKLQVLKNKEILQSSVGRSLQNPDGESANVHNNQNNAYYQVNQPKLSATRTEVRHSNHIKKCQKQSTKHSDICTIASISDINKLTWIVNDKKLIRRGDSERELFYDNTVHALKIQ